MRFSTEKMTTTMKDGVRYSVTASASDYEDEIIVPNDDDDDDDDLEGIEMGLVVPARATATSNNNNKKGGGVANRHNDRKTTDVVKVVVVKPPMDQNNYPRFELEKSCDKLGSIVFKSINEDGVFG